jgi:hypothetical protein
MHLNSRLPVLHCLLFIFLTLFSFVRPDQSLIADKIASSKDRLQNSLFKPVDISQTAQARISEALNKFPMSFEINEGQVDSRIQYVSRGLGHTLFLMPTEAVFTVREPKQTLSSNSHRGFVEQLQDKSTFAAKSTLLAQSNRLETSTLRMKILRANSNAKVQGVDPLPGKNNYLVGNKPKDWQTNIFNYSKVRYDEIYAGIDLLYYGNQQDLEYDFILKPGADVDTIGLAFEGAKNIRLDVNGDLILSLPEGEIRQRIPFAYQEVNGTKKEIPANYIVKENGEIGFTLGDYEKNADVIIDPVLVYSTFLGGSAEEVGIAVSFDPAGNAYITGRTFSFDFPLANPLQQNFGGVFISKINAAGTAFLYSTYIGGGSFNEGGTGIAVDSSGNAYVTGFTFSENFPTTPGAFDTTYNGNRDSFVLKLNATGNQLLYSTLIGGSSSDDASGIAIDATGNAYITGSTESDYPTTPNAFRTTGGGDAFITKFNATGSALVYSTLLGGDETELGRAIAVDASGFACVTGGTYSTDFPLANALQPMKAGYLDAYVTKLNQTGTGLIFSTYLGGNDNEFGADLAWDITTDAVGNIYVGGYTYSSNFPVTAGAYQTVKIGQYNGFVTKLSPTGSALYSTYVGHLADSVQGLAVDALGNCYMAGSTFGSFPTTAGALQPNLGGGQDVFVAKLNAAGTALTYGSYFGGSKHEYALGIALDRSGNIYLQGLTFSANFPTTPTSPQPVYGGGDTVGIGGDAFLVKLYEPPPFDICLRDDSNSNLLQLNSTTGSYQFTNCAGVILGGIGVLNKKGSTLTLQHNSADKKVMVQVDSSLKRATASLQISSSGRTFTIIDRNITDNICACPSQ